MDKSENKISITKLLKLDQPEGSVMHGLKKSDKSFSGFGEAYFSTVKFNKIKGWKLHKKMTLNLVVPHGEIRIIAHKASDNDDVVSPLVDIVLEKIIILELPFLLGIGLHLRNWKKIKYLNEHS